MSSNQPKETSPLNQEDIERASEIVDIARRVDAARRRANWQTWDRSIDPTWTSRAFDQLAKETGLQPDELRTLDPEDPTAKSLIRLGRSVRPANRTRY